MDKKVKVKLLRLVFILLQTTILIYFNLIIDISTVIYIISVMLSTSIYVQIPHIVQQKKICE